MRRWSLVVALLAAALALAACGGGEEEEEDKIAALRSEAAGLEAEIDDLGGEIEALREEIAAGNERIEAAEARADEAGIALVRVEREVGALAREVDEGRARQDALAEEVSGGLEEVSEGVEAMAEGLEELSDIVNGLLRAPLVGYFQELARLGREFDEETNRFFEALEIALLDDDLPGGRGAINGVVVAVRIFADGIAELAPPPPVGGAHSEGVASAAGLADVIAGWPGEIAGVTTFEDFEAAFEDLVTRPEVEAAGERLDAACATLQDLAQEFEINVDIHCG